MKKILLSTSLITLLYSNAFSADNLDVVEVSVATKTKQNIDGVAATVNVITQKDIEKMGAENLKDIIEKTPGLSVQYGTFPSASSKSKSSISIRGMGANGTLFLLDGRRLAGEVKNPYDLDRIPASIIERIEIVKGPMSSLYGADAVGGVINIITKRPTDEVKIEAGVRYGQNQDSDAQNLNMNLSLQNKVDKFAYSVYAGYTTTEPYTQKERADVWVPSTTGKDKPSDTAGNTFPPTPIPDMSAISDYYNQDVTYREDSSIYTLGTRLSYDFSRDLQLGIDINYFNEERDGQYIGYFHPSAYTMAGGPNAGNPVPVYNVPVDSHDENERLDTSIDLSYTINEDIQVKARLYRSYYEKRNTTSAVYWQDLNYASKEASEQNGMDADVDLKVAELSATYLAIEDHLISAGAEYRDEKRNATVFNQSPQMSEKKVDYQSLYLQDEWDISEKLNMIIGARYDAISNADNKPTFRLGGLYEFDKIAKLRLNVAQGYRTPDIRELYIHKQTPNGLQIGANVMGYDLKPESTNALEMGLGGKSNSFSYDLVLYYNQIKDMIAQVMGTYNSTAAYTFVNIADANTMGMELSLAYRFTNKVYTNFFWNELKTENERTNRDLEFHPDRTLMLSFNWPCMFSDNLNYGLTAKYVGKQHYTDVINRGAPTQTTNANAKTNDFTLVDFTLDYKLNKMLDIYGGVNNLGNEGVDDVLGSNVGRYYFAGVRGHF
ncbi:TonB-dependent receptor [Sulfurimonas lithotrophica]|uniref:TonB-dependent receptor n=1 Tax=Sulfurimonas lithotrophica TaxID=2590022 RepID=A0A5P8P2Z3_9BACT|nr:TonB-dependent receptor [Sulfurimonas lithotrophica]QFR49981.1 TonB-dependent receptor [Sulfurimonas lithotrophica]